MGSVIRAFLCRFKKVGHSKYIYYKTEATLQMLVDLILLYYFTLLDADLLK